MISPASFAPRLHARHAGRGPLAVCLHSSGSSSSQWQPLIEAQQDRLQFIAVDLHGHGKSPSHGSADYTLRSESEAVLQLLAAVDTPIHLVGHSYGGAVALDLAARYPERFASATVYEPVLFGVLPADSDDYRAMTAVGLAIVAHARAGRLTAASSAFIDFWSGAGTWQSMPPEAQQRVVARIEAVADHFTAIFADPLPLPLLRRLRVPTRLIFGDRSPAPALAVARCLTRAGVVEGVELPGTAHMGPVTHAAAVNPLIVEHIARWTERTPLAAAA